MSTACNALLLVGPGHVECQSHSVEPFDHYSPEHGVGWSDNTPGAKPNEPRYRVVRDAEHWIVRDRNGRLVAWFSGSGDHPDPRGEARDQADRLNGRR